MYAKAFRMALRKVKIVQILCTELYQTQLHSILESKLVDGIESVKRFKTYLDAIVMNIPTKVEKYKSSASFEDENIKEIDFENFILLVHCNKEQKCFLVLSIIEKIKN